MLKTWWNRVCSKFSHIFFNYRSTQLSPELYLSLFKDFKHTLSWWMPHGWMIIAKDQAIETPRQLCVMHRFHLCTFSLYSPAYPFKQEGSGVWVFFSYVIPTKVAQVGTLTHVHQIDNQTNKLYLSLSFNFLNYLFQLSNYACLLPKFEPLQIYQVLFCCREPTLRDIPLIKVS